MILNYKKFKESGDKMYKCILCLKNESEWFSYAKNILDQTSSITDKTIETILTFPFEFGSIQANS